jgi:arylsulfatase A-like enzyme
VQYADRRAVGGRGLKLNRFHTTALCSPTRQALLTGRNHHSVGMGGVTEMATSAPGYSSIRPKDKAPIAETLVLNGYSTAQFGKCHEVPVWEVSPVGPFTQWPTGSGFEYFYGFIGGEANQYYPGLYEGTAPVEPPKTPEEGYTDRHRRRQPRPPHQTRGQAHDRDGAAIALRLEPSRH